MQVAAAPLLENFRREWQRELNDRRRRREVDGMDNGVVPNDRHNDVIVGRVSSSVEEEMHERVSSLLSSVKQRIRQSPLGSVQSRVPCSDAQGCTPHDPLAGPCPISTLPDTLLLRIFSCISNVSDLSRVSLCCRWWQRVSLDPRIWRRLCFKQWPLDSQLHLLCTSDTYGGDWRRLRMRRPLLRCDGVYCAKVSYVRRGLAEWTMTTPLQQVVYYRYARFFEDGSVVWGMSFDQPYRRTALKKNKKKKQVAMMAAKMDKKQASKYENAYYYKKQLEEAVEEDEDEETEHQVEEEEDPLWQQKSLLTLLRHDKVGTHLPRCTVLGGVYDVTYEGDERDEVHMAVRADHTQSTYRMQWKLHRSRHRHLLQWMLYTQHMDRDGRVIEFNNSITDAPVFMFVHENEL